jgi:hypothetical protein
MLLIGTYVCYYKLLTNVSNGIPGSGLRLILHLHKRRFEASKFVDNYWHCHRLVDREHPYVEELVRHREKYRQVFVVHQAQLCRGLLKQ